ncbi:glutamyl-tRNA reductase [Aestuariivivens sediminicola]|uniref:glutamyl-tRNA reductase n=1 Tax=Aestuariivivens sediminicola TaxID=2913560 RepID=UPI001F5A6F28|nr:glutamyl-tRNA reductase [Aestuariivivens sediminicola]
MELQDLQIPEIKTTVEKELKYFGVSHKTASVTQRELFHLSENEKEQLVGLICRHFSDVSGLLILATCNRTEIYFESSKTKASEILNFFVNFKGQPKQAQEVFVHFNDTESTVKHLLQVSSGLESLVLGDAEIIHQIKKAYQFSMQTKLQGSLLERALQTVFKTHKRISNETNFRDGTTSVAYKALKAIRDFYGKNEAKSKKILFIGAGDIVKQLFKYNSKFNFKNIHLSNRSISKANILAQRNSVEIYPWNNVMQNEFDDFDVIISAVSNCQHIVKNISNTEKNILLIDLGVPSNIDQKLADKANIAYYNLDTISSELHETKAKRLEALKYINVILNEEMELLNEWIKTAPVRKAIIEYKKKVSIKIKNQLLHDKNYSEEKAKELTNDAIKKLLANAILT